MSLGREFKAFVLRGSVVDLAVGVVIGAAFTAVVTAFTKDLITPLIPTGGTAFSDLKVGPLLVGDFINSVIAFLLVAAVIFFLVVKPVNMLMERSKTETPVEPTTRDCPFCLSKIPIAASRCAFCTSEVKAGPVA